MKMAPLSPIKSLPLLGCLACLALLPAEALAQYRGHDHGSHAYAGNSYRAVLNQVDYLENVTDVLKRRHVEDLKLAGLWKPKGDYRTLYRSISHLEEQCNSFKKNYRKNHGDSRYVHQAVVKIEATVNTIRKQSRYVRTCRHLHKDLNVVSENLATLHGVCGKHYPNFGRRVERVPQRQAVPYANQRQTWRQPPRPKKKAYQMQSDYRYQQQQAEAQRRAEEAHRAAIEAQRRRIEAERRRNRGGSGWSFRLF